MNNTTPYIALLCASLIGSTVALAQEEAEITTSLTVGQTDDIDFDTRSATLGLKAITPYGLMQCDFSRTTGETRVATFDDIFGVTPVGNMPWNNYDADKYQCGYGMKMPLLGGELVSGIGIMRYDGETDTFVDGKEITLDAASLKVSFSRGDYQTALKYIEKKYDFLYNYNTMGYNSDTSGKERSLELNGRWGAVHAEAEQVIGHKERAFTTALFPYAELDYERTTVFLGPRFDGDGPLRYIAPTFIGGSEPGSFNAMRIDRGLRGGVVGMEFDGITVRASYTDTSSEGSRDYSPVTTDLAEANTARKVAIALQGEKWSLKLENKRSRHDGYVTVTNVVIEPTTPIVFPYATLVGCGTPPCSYDNYREEREWKLSWRYDYSESLALLGDLYQRHREDQQFENAAHDYKESGGNIGVAVTF